jgi:hypothetical protein
MLELLFLKFFPEFFLLWPILYYVTETRDKFAWTGTEVLRYLYSSLGLLLKFFATFTNCFNCYWSSSLPLLIAWTVTEVFRDLYYILNLLSAVPAITVVQINITIFKFYFWFYYPIMFSFEQIFFFINLVSFWNNGWAYFLFYALPYYSITQQF